MTTSIQTLALIQSLSSPYPSTNDIDLMSLRNSLIDCKGALTDLTALMERIQQAIPYLQKRVDCLANALGIRSVPDEVLAIIAESLAEDDRDIIEFSHTCRRFRNCALSLPKIWSNLRSTYHEQKLLSFIQRSKDARLHISLTHQNDFNISSQVAFLEKVLPLQNRWESFSLRTRCISHTYERGRRRFLGTLNKLCTGISLPSLETLSIAHGSLSDLTPASGDGDIDFYSSWTMPNLHILSVEGFVPRNTFEGSLTTFNFSFYGGHFTDLPRSINLRHFRDIFESCPKLEVLKFSTYNIWFSHDSSADSFVLSSVRSLELDVATHTFDPNCITSILHNLILPNLTEMVIRIKVDHWNQTALWLEQIFKNKNDFSCVERLEIQAILGKYDNCNMDDMFLKLHNLSYLSIDLQEDDLKQLWTSALAPVSPHLQTICFRGCKGFSDSVAVPLLWKIRFYRPDDAPDPFIIVNGCPSFRKHAFSLLPDGKLCWID